MHSMDILQLKAGGIHKSIQYHILHPPLSTSYHDNFPSSHDMPMSTLGKSILLFFLPLSYTISPFNFNFPFLFPIFSLSSHYFFSFSFSLYYFTPLPHSPPKNTQTNIFPGYVGGGGAGVVSYNSYKI